MTKHLLIAASAALFFLGSCDEKGPAIDFSNVEVTDTTYVDAVPAPQPRNVLVEEFTGVECTNCPAGTAILEASEAANPGRVIVVSLHAGAQTTPLPESQYNFANAKALDLMNSYFGVLPPKPAASIDRTQNGSGEYFVFKEVWTSMIDNRLLIPTPVNMYVSSSYNAASGEATIKVKIVYTASVSAKQNLNIAIVESGIVDAQEYPDHIDVNYTHNNVFRDFVTPVNGKSLRDDVTKTAGRVFEQTFHYTVDAAWKLENCHVVAFVNNNGSGDKEVAQVAETPLKP